MVISQSLIAYNNATDIPGLYNYADLAYDVTGSTITSGSYGLVWGQTVSEIDHFTFITNTFTQSLAGGTFNDSTPIFYVTPTSSIETLNLINRFPDRVTETPFSDFTSALNWVSGSGKYITLLDGNLWDYPLYTLQENGYYLTQENNSLLNIY